MQSKEPPEAKALLEQLVLLCKREDPSRLSTLATNFAEAGGSYGEDVTAHNQYFGWYTGDFDDFPAWLDAQRAKAPAAPLAIAEYGAGAGSSIHYDEPRKMDHSEEFQCLYHEASWRALSERPWLVCTSIWVLFDFASAGRAEGESLGINDKGLVTRDRKLKKDAFYFYKAQWSREPFVHITSRRFVARRRAKTQVKVYSNLSWVELSHNGRSLGARPVEAGVALWPEVELTPWSNEIVASAGEVKDSVVWILNVFYNPWATAEAGD
jgi:beta-galactosidase